MNLSGGELEDRTRSVICCIRFVIFLSKRIGIKGLNDYGIGVSGSMALL